MASTSKGPNRALAETFEATCSKATQGEEYGRAYADSREALKEVSPTYLLISVLRRLPKKKEIARKADTAGTCHWFSRRPQASSGNFWHHFRTSELSFSESLGFGICRVLACKSTFAYACGPSCSLQLRPRRRVCFEQNDEMLAIVSREAYVGRQRRIRDRLWLSLRAKRLRFGAFRV